MAKKNKIEKSVVTPIGEVKWFKLITPDEKYHKYTCDLIVEDSAELQKLLEIIQELEQEQFDVAVANAKPQNKKKVKLSGNSCIEPEYDEAGEETGRYVIKLRQNSQYKDKNDQIKKLFPPRLFDSKAKEISGEAKQQLVVYNGSKARAQLTLSAYFVPSIGVGVSARPAAVQIVELAEGGSGGAPSFDSVDGGFESSFEATEDAGDGDF
jgi:hypothetical protein